MSLKEIHQHREQRPLNILITGSSAGIGLAAARRLVEQGHTVYHACRTSERAQLAVKAAGGGVPMVCNLADLHSVKTFAQQVHSQIPYLDVVCCNAGIAPSTKSVKPPLTAQGFEACIGVNHLGHFLLAQLLAEKLAASKASGDGGDDGGRLVLTASSVHDPALKAGQSGGKTASLGDLSGLGVNLLGNKTNSVRATMLDGSVDYHGAKVYKDSKLCNILMCRQAVREFPDSVTTVCFNPGFVPTTGLFDSLRKESWFRAQALTFFANIVGFSIPVEIAGDRLVYMATAPNLKSGVYYCAPAKSRGTMPENGFVATPVSKDASNDALAAKLWQKSLEVVRDWLA